MSEQLYTAIFIRSKEITRGKMKVIEDIIETHYDLTWKGIGVIQQKYGNIDCTTEEQSRRLDKLPLNEMSSHLPCTQRLAPIPREERLVEAPKPEPRRVGIIVGGASHGAATYSALVDAMMKETAA